MERRNFLVAAATTTGLAATANADAGNKPVESADPADLVFEIARQRFGAKLTPEQLAVVKAQIAGNLQVGRALAQTPLTNADEPVLAPSSIYRTWP